MSTDGIEKSNVSRVLNHSGSKSRYQSITNQAHYKVDIELDMSSTSDGVVDEGNIERVEKQT